MTDVAHPPPISRRLRMRDPESREHRIVAQDELASISGPVVVLGDPGLGKSVLARAVGELAGNVYVRAGTFVRSRRPEQYRPNDGVLVVDGLDEVGSTAVGAGVDAVLAQLSAVCDPPPRFLLAGREADWRGSADRIRIEDDYGREATVLHLMAFDRDDATRFLSDVFPHVDAEGVLNHLAERGLDEIYRNPLTLRMVGEVAAVGGDLPATRARLLDRAVQLMLAEANPRHHAAAHATTPGDELLLAAGAACASVLLCDRAGIHDGPEVELPDDHLPLAGVAALPFAGAVGLALRTRLFQAEDENRFVPIHRVVAEHLAARWLAACHAAGASERRLRALISHGGGVPSSLRGLNAWLAHFAERLAPGCIALDPYAVLRYGDAETLSLRNAGLLLDALASLSIEDPYFRSEDWGEHPVSGLVRIELRGRLVAILGGPAGAGQLGVMLLGAIRDTAVAAAMATELEARVFDPGLAGEVRGRAVAALLPIGLRTGAVDAVARLLALGDHASAGIAYEIVRSERGTDVPPELVASTVLAYAGLSRSHLGRGRRRAHRSTYIDADVFDDMATERLERVLDALSGQASQLMRHSDHWSKEQVADVVRAAAAGRLGRPEAVDADRVWRWVGWLRGHEGHDDDVRRALRERLRAAPDLRRSVQASVLLSGETEAIRSAWFRMSDARVGFELDADDVAALLDRHAATRSAFDQEVVVELASLGRDREGLPAPVRAAAERAADGDAATLAAIEAMSRPFLDRHAAERERRQAEQEAERQERYLAIRGDMARQMADLVVGSGPVLNQAAKVYLGRYSEFDRQAAPEERVVTLLGPGLGEAALLGFVASLSRDDLPSARTIAEDHAANREWVVEPVLVCGIAEMVRRGMELSSLPAAALDAAFMAWRRAGESNVVGGVDIGPPLEAVVLPEAASVERFFRTSVEPQLTTGENHPRDLYLLRHRPAWAMLAGRLAVEWLVRFPGLPAGVAADLLETALRCAPTADARRAVLSARGRVHADRQAMLTWLSAEFVVAFDDAREAVAAVAADDPSTIWHFRNRVGARSHHTMMELSVAQRAFLAGAFMEAWPNMERPEGTSSGEENDWDASAFIQRLVYSVAGEHTPEATAALETLLARASTYDQPLRHALALQRRIRRDREFVAADLPGLASVTAGGLPGDVDDMRAFLGDRIDALRARMHTGTTDMWEAYWDDDRPRPENFCRNRLIEHLSRELPEVIRLEPEMHMPDQKRADVAAILGAVGLPVEIKGQWHPQVWTAPVEQLAARYAREWHAHGRGVYVVIWFGDLPGRNLPSHPDGLPRPKTPDALADMLRDCLPSELRGLIDVHVVDVSRSRPAKAPRRSSGRARSVALRTERTTSQGRSVKESRTTRD